MKTKYPGLSEKILNYSVFSSAFLLLKNTDGQIVYHDLDPDIVLAYNGDSYDLDVDGDGNSNFFFNKFSWYTTSSWWASEPSFGKGIDVQGADAWNFLAGSYVWTGLCSSCSSTFLTPYALNEGAIISFYYDFYHGSAMAELFDDYFGGGGAGNWFPDTEDKYLGVWIHNPGEGDHFGWVRCSVIDDYVLIIKDFAYNETPDEPVMAGLLTPVISPPGWVALSDQGDHINGDDLGFTFYSVPSESLFEEYRVFAVKDSVAGSFTLTDAMAIDPDSYVSISPNGSVWYLDDFDGKFDVDGDPITNHVNYRLFVVAVADPLSGAVNLISDPSEIISLESITYPATNLLLTDYAETGTAADIHLQFTNAIKEVTIEQYRLFLLNVSMLFDGFTIADAQNVLPGNYTEISPNGMPIDMQLPSGMNDISGEPITWGVPYYAFVMSMDNGLGTGDTLSTISNELILNYPVLISELNTEHPAVYFESSTLVIDPMIADLQQFTLTIINTEGRTVFRLAGLQGQQRIPLQLSAGIYIVTLSNGTEKFSKEFSVVE